LYLRGEILFSVFVAKKGFTIYNFKREYS